MRECFVGVLPSAPHVKLSIILGLISYKNMVGNHVRTILTPIFKTCVVAHKHTSCNYCGSKLSFRTCDHCSINALVVIKARVY